MLSKSAAVQCLKDPGFPRYVNTAYVTQMADVVNRVNSFSEAKAKHLFLT